MLKRFEVKQSRIIRKAPGYFVLLSRQVDVDVHQTMLYGHLIGIDVGLKYFLSTSAVKQQLFGGTQSIFNHTAVWVG